ncbi:GTPase HRas-like [Octopus sinensis]|uniref:GTPase HRas-like n=1 Tax=Octopus sinensis TaxID=2607531 RepID=A0A6P7U2H9_9MOLL|nr:GTPase HRas-like [Octopus sinensis]
MEEHNIVVMGSGGVGKSALTMQFTQDIFVIKYDPTIEDSYCRNKVIDNKECALEILDTAGTEQFYSVYEMYMRKGDGFLLVYSVSEPQTFDWAQNLYKQIQEYHAPNKVPAVIVGNKCDMESSRKVSTANLLTLGKTLGIPVFETSAKTAVNVERAFCEIVRLIRSKKRSLKYTSKRKCTII